MSCVDLMHDILSNETFRFLGDVSEGRDKPWFDANRARYEAHVLEPMRALAETVARPLAARIPDLETQPAINKMLTRIHRDMRFAPKGASPYKDHMLALFYRQGRKKKDPQLFVGVQPKEIWMGLYLGPERIAAGSPMARAVAERPEAVVALGRACGVGDALTLAACKRYGEVVATFAGGEAGDYLQGPHLCALARRSAEVVAADPERCVADAARILTGLIPLWSAYGEGPFNEDAC